MVRTRIWTCVPVVALAALALAAPARAGDVDKYLPADTETVMVVNVRQILGSALVKKVGLDHFRDALKAQEEVSTILKELGLDPFKDVDRLVVAGPAGGEQDKGLIIVHGRFNLAKIKARAEKAAKDNKDVFKIQKIKDGQGGTHTIYKFPVPNPQGQDVTFYAGMASKTTLLFAPSKDYLIDALKVKDKTKVRLKSKAFQELLGNLNSKQSMSIAIVGSALRKSPLKDLPIKDVLEKITAVAGGFTFTDGIKMEFTVATKAAADAKAINEKISNGLNTGLALLALAAMNEKKLAPLLDIVKSIKTTTKGKRITLKGEVGADSLGKLIPKDQ